jgi:hypothetical protein
MDEITVEFEFKINIENKVTNISETIFKNIIK